MRQQLQRLRAAIKQWWDMSGADAFDMNVCDECMNINGPLQLVAVPRAGLVEACGDCAPVLVANCGGQYVR